MHLCFYSDSQVYGGSEYYVSLLARNLTDRGYQVSVIMNSLPQMSEWGSSLRNGGINVVQDLVGIYALLTWLKSFRPDVFHINMPGPYCAAYGGVALLAKMAGIKAVITTEHVPSITGPKRLEILKRFFDNWTDSIITEASMNVKYLVETHGANPRKIHRIYHGVDIGRYCPLTGEGGYIRDRLGFGPDELLVALIGRLHPQKGHDYLIRAAATLRSRYPSCHYLFIGEGKQRNELELLVQRHSLQDRVTFLGFRSDIADLLQVIDVVVMPSRLEGLPFVLLEAMAAAVPVVASDLECLREVITDGFNGFLVPVGDVSSLASSLDHLLRDRKLRTAIGANARQTITERFNLEMMIDQTEQVYLEVLTQSH